MRIRILDRYILSNHIGPYCFSLAIITFIFVMDFIIRWLDKFIGKGVSVLTILEFFFLSLGHMFALIIPMAVMPATLMAFGQLAADNEVTAIKSSGVSLYRMIVPVLAATAALTLGLVFYFNMLLPESNHRLMNLMLDIGRMKPTLQIKENMFSDALAGYTILVREKNDKTGEIKGVQIFELKGGLPRSIIATGGRMIYREGESVLRFELDDGEIHEMPDPVDIKTYRRTFFKHFTLNIQDTERTLKRSDRTHRNDREMTVAMMRAKILEYAGTSASTRAHMNQVALERRLRAAPASRTRRGESGAQDRKPGGADPADTRDADLRPRLEPAPDKQVRRRDPQEIRAPLQLHHIRSPRRAARDPIGQTGNDGLHRLQHSLFPRLLYLSHQRGEARRPPAHGAVARDVAREYRLSRRRRVHSQADESGIRRDRLGAVQSREMVASCGFMTDTSSAISGAISR
jgi:lipopolysaccharide export system permease protein